MSTGRARFAGTPTVPALLVFAFVFAFAFLLNGCATATSGPTDPRADAAAPITSEPAPTPPTPASEPTASEAPTPGPPSVPASVVPVPVVDADLSAQPAAAAGPARVRVDLLAIDMTVEAASLDAAGSMALAENPEVASWYRFGPAPGAAGATVIAAHVDSLRYGLGPFAKLATAPAGTEITITTTDGVDHRYSVESVNATAKSEVPWDTVFDRTGPPRLTLVTCGGEFNYTTRQYQSNIIVTALPLP